MSDEEPKPLRPVELAYEAWQLGKRTAAEHPCQHPANDCSMHSTQLALGMLVLTVAGQSRATSMTAMDRGHVAEVRTWLRMMSGSTRTTT